MANEKRLIDAVRFRETLDRYANAPHVKMTHSALSKAMRMAIDTCIELLDMQRPVNAVEVIHAHWEDGCAIHNGKEVYKSIDCSHCNEIFKTDDREYWKARFKVCPFCGAIMDGGNEDG